MSTKSNTPKKPSLAHYADKQVTPLIADYVAWLKAETGYDVDPMSILLGSSLRGAFQKSAGNQKRIAEQTARIEAEVKARADRKVARAEAAAAKQAEAAAVAKVKVEAAKAAPSTPAKAKVAPAAKPTPARRRRPVVEVAPTEAAV